MRLCFRCGQPAFATLSITASIGQTTLAVNGQAKPTAVCEVCMTELAEWFKVRSELFKPASLRGQ
jgi:hypothetical protein